LLTAGEDLDALARPVRQAHLVERGDCPLSAGSPDPQATAAEQTRGDDLQGGGRNAGGRGEPLRDVTDPIEVDTAPLRDDVMAVEEHAAAGDRREPDD